MRRTYLTLSEEDKDYLKTLSKKRTIQAQIVDRAKILLYGGALNDFNNLMPVKTESHRAITSWFRNY